MLIFNPEHDLCLANGDPNFVAPTSAMKFGRDCCNVLKYIVRPTILFSEDGDIKTEEDVNEDVYVWGWNQSIKNSLLKKGICPSKLPNDEQILNIRNLSHRRMSVKAWNYISGRISPQFKDNITADSPIEITDLSQVIPLLAKRNKLVFKAPWSGSGKGLRWANFKESDLCESNKTIISLKNWCSKTIKSQESVIVETQDCVIQDFAMLFHISCKDTDGHDKSSSDVNFIGYSLFNCNNGAYKSNILASDEHILQIIGNYIPLSLLVEIKELMTNFLQLEFAGKYEGYLGIDMYICDGNSHEESIKNGNKLQKPQYKLQPCVEINVRMTMGLLAHSIFNSQVIPLKSGRWEMTVIHDKDNEKLRRTLSNAAAVLTPVNQTTNYAIAILPIQPNPMAQINTTSMKQ